MASFSDIDNDSGGVKLYLKRNWTAFEKVFRDGMPAFTSAISVANKHVDLPMHCEPDKKMDDGEKKFQAEHVLPKEVSIEETKDDKKVGENMPKEKGSGDAFVEYASVARPKEGLETEIPSQPAQPKESCLSTQSDPFDEVFGTESHKETKTTQTQPAPVVMVSPSPATVRVLTSEVKFVPYVEPKAPAEVATENPFTDGFDVTKFADVRKTADAIIQKAPRDIDLDQIQKEYMKYAVEYSVDAYRSNADTLADHMARVQSQKDRVNTILIQLTSMKESMNAAEDFYSSFGVLCSNASSREKREAQVKYHLRDFYSDLANVERLHAMYEQAEKGLNRQIETLSRLLSVHLGKRPNFLQEPERAMIPMAPEPVRGVATSPMPDMTCSSKATVSPQRPTSKRGLDGLEDFESNPVIPKVRNHGTQEVDF